MPTYNRADLLERAIDSVLRQTYVDWELIISDNASTDATRAVCERAVARDGRIRYTCQAVNLGMNQNFSAVAMAASGDYFMYLADDDWLDDTFVAECVRTLDERPDVVIACGAVRTFEGERLVRERLPFDLPHESRVRRVLAFFAGTSSKGVFYGLRRRAMQEHIGPMGEYVSSDLSEIGALAWLGKFVALPGTHLNQTPGVSVSLEEVARTMGLSRFHERHPTLTFAIYYGLADIGWRSPAYRTASPSARITLAVAAMAVWLARRGQTRVVLPRVRRAQRLVRKAAKGPQRRVRWARRRIRRLRRRAAKLRRPVRRWGRPLLGLPAAGLRRMVGRDRSAS